MTVFDKLKRKKTRKNTSIIAGAIGLASLIVAGIKIKRELWGPGGTKLSRYDRSVDKIRDKRARP